MTQQENSKLSKRDSIRNKLKGSLLAWKLNPMEQRSRNIGIQDRTPQPCITESNFDDMFQLGKKIGEGASGCVNLCTSKRDGKTYAVKRSRGDVELLRINKRTFKIMKTLSHPSIIRAKSLFLNQVTEDIHFVMEHCPNPALSLQCDALSYQQKKQIVRQIIECLNYLHSEGICHRDIKLDNILYNELQETIKVIDFGISKRILGKNDQRIRMWTATGTLHYMAPQMLSGKTYDQKVDMWALGVLVYRLFNYKFPFDSSYKSEVIDQIQTQQPEYCQSDTLLANFIKYLLQKDPSSRLSAQQCLKHPWIQKDMARTKQRLGSGDDFDGLFEYRIRNYSVAIPESPEIKISRQEIISELKELNIFENKKQYKKANVSLTQV